MTVVWPQSLLTEVAERRCVFLLGAGASASSFSEDGTRNPPDWPTFLAAGAALMPPGASGDAAKEMIASRAFLDAAQVIEDALGAPDFSRFVRDQLETPRFQPSEIHELILEIDPKIVITTNYDQIYETLAQRGAAVEGYNVVRYYDEHFVNDLRSNRRLIVKAHGCVSNPQRVILTRKKYFEARRDFPAFYATLDAIFLTSTILFIGSGFSGDPDIELVLQNVNVSAPSDHPHFALVEEGRHASVKQAIEHTYNVRFLEYPSGRHDEVVAALGQLRDDVASYRAVAGPA